MARTNGEGRSIDEYKAEGDKRARDAKKGEDEKDAEEVVEVKSEEPAAPKKKSALVNMAEIVIVLVGVVGVVGALLLDPVMNIFDSGHSADINIGTTQMMGVVAAMVVLIAGLVMIAVSRIKPSTG